MKKLLLVLSLLCAAALGSSWLLIQSTSAPVTKLLDNFTDTNGTLLELHTPDVTTAGGWVRATANNAIIQSNTLTKNSGSDPLYLVNTTGTYVTITATLNLNTSDQQVDLYFGASSTSSFASGLILITDPATSTWGVHDYVLNTDLIPQTSTHTFSAGAQTWKLVYSATSVAYYIDGALIGSYSGPVANYGGVCGLEFYPFPLTTWSQYKVTSP